MLTNNYLIINKRAQAFSEMKIAGKTAVFVNDAVKVLDFGVTALDDTVYAILTCEEVKLVMLVIDRQGERRVEGIFWKEEDDYRKGAEAIGRASGMRLSKQDLKISSYAWSIAKKLDDGVRIKVTDALDTSDMTVCPECGMMNPKGTPYCLECGAEL